MNQPKKVVRPTKGLVLLDCVIGITPHKINTLIEASADVIEAAVRAGQVDAHPNAVAQAKSS